MVFWAPKYVNQIKPAKDGIPGPGDWLTQIHRGKNLEVKEGELKTTEIFKDIDT